MMRFRAIVILAAAILPLMAWQPASGDSGVLVPWGWNSAAPSKELKLGSMDVDVRIMGGYATVKVAQIHESLTGRVLEGRYVFVLPERAAISDFAVWDDGVRIPGVILERGRAQELYQEIKSRAIDPGLMEVEDPDRSLNEFSAKIVPIPPNGTKRLELAYTQELETVGGETRLKIALAPNRYNKQWADKFALNVRVEDAADYRNVSIDRPGWSLLDREDEGARIWTFYGEKVEFSHDVTITLTRPEEDLALDFKAYRDPLTDLDRQRRSIHGFSDKSDGGYFSADLFFGKGEEDPLQDPLARPFYLLLDTSYSMRGMKLERAWEGLNLILESLPDGTSFNLATFSTEFRPYYAGSYVPLDDRVRAEVLEFVAETPLMGGTDLSLALPSAVLGAAGSVDTEGTPNLMVITDGRSSYGELAHAAQVSAFRDAMGGEGPRPFVLAVGNDADLSLLNDFIADTDGYLTWLTDAGDTALACASLITALKSGAISGVTLDFGSAAGGVSDIYPKTPQRALQGGRSTFVGRYASPVVSAPLTVADALGLSKEFTVALPERDTRYPEVRRRWARARVDYLLDLINSEGEKDEWIEEIVQLSKEFNFVTPYTAFLAAPRSLIRPRSIRPGDPVLRVRTDPSIVQVTAFFPFGLVRELDWLADEDVWETRFLAPPEMRDGEYWCTLALRDTAGNVFGEKKSFLIDSRPPRLSAEPLPASVSAGEEIELRVAADSDTRWIRASFDGMPFVELKWSDKELTNVGRLKIPPGASPGPHEIRLTARDFAHNNSALSIPVTVGGAR